MTSQFLPQHLAYFAARANPIALAEQRGSQTISHRQARKRGYRVPLKLKAPDHPLDGLLFIIHRPDGSTSEQLRLDIPIPDPDDPGKFHRYLNLPGKPAKGIDVHPSNLARLPDLSIPRVLTEGVAHVDAITGAGWLGIGVTGVWMAVVKRDDGTYELHPTVKQANPPGSIVMMGFDPDQMTKSQVHDALRVTSSLLRDHGCLVLYLHVPATFNGQPVDGIDTYLATGGTMAELVAGATMELPPLKGSDGAQTCQCAECPDREEVKLLRRERVDQVRLDALKGVDASVKALARRLVIDSRYAKLRGVDYKPTQEYLAQRLGLGLRTVAGIVDPVTQALGYTLKPRMFRPGELLPSGQRARNHLTETTYTPPTDLTDLDIVKRLEVLVKPSKRGGDRRPTSTINACEQHPDSQGELIRTVVCKVGREPLARLKPITVALHRPLPPEHAKTACSVNPVPPVGASFIRSPFRTPGDAKIACSGANAELNAVAADYERLYQRAAQAAIAPPPTVPIDPLADLKADPLYQQLDYGSKARWEARRLAELASDGAA